MSGLRAPVALYAIQSPVYFNSIILFLILGNGTLD